MTFPDHSKVERKDPIQAVPQVQQEVNQSSHVKVDIDFHRITSAICSAIRESKDSRASRLKHLDPTVNEKVLVLEHGLEILKDFSLRLSDLNVQIPVLTEKQMDLPPGAETQLADLEAELDTLEKRIKAETQNMKAFISKLIAENKELGITQEYFSDWWRVDRIEKPKQELSILFMQEQLINRCVNRICFLNDTWAAIEEQKEAIVSAFYQGAVQDLDLKQVTFELFPHGSETHNRGKVPVKISFRLEGEELFSVFFKPRDARIDARVIQLFRDLNALPTEEKSLDAVLPTYVIMNISDSFSLWEFIEGQHAQGETASGVIEKLQETPEKHCLSAQLLRLESVCKFLGVSDLHHENIIFSHLGEVNSQIIPIDLESVQPGNPTGLFPLDPETPPFTEAERALLVTCKQDIFGNVPARFVPIHTSHFLGALTRCDSFVRMANLIEQAIREKSYQVLIHKDRLEWLILNDFLHNDVPYLTEYQSKIYYGPHLEGEILAEKPESKE